MVKAPGEGGRESSLSFFVHFDEMRLYHFEAFMYTLVIQHRIHRIHPRQKSFIFGKNW